MLLSIIMVQWKIILNERQLSYWRYTHPLFMYIFFFWWVLAHSLLGRKMQVYLNHEKKKLTAFHWILVGSWGSFFWFMKIIPIKPGFYYFIPKTYTPNNRFWTLSCRMLNFESTNILRSPNFQPRKKLLQVMRWCQRLDREGFSAAGEAEEKYMESWTIGPRDFLRKFFMNE